MNAERTQQDALAASDWKCHGSCASMLSRSQMSQLCSISANSMSTASAAAGSSFANAAHFMLLPVTLLFLP
jgi:hypothetical protein